MLGTLQLYSTKQAADLLGIKEQTLTAWRHYGRGPAFIKIGNRVLYRAEDLKAFTDANRHQSTSEPSHGGSPLRDAIREAVRDTIRELAREGCFTA
jgi:excisionase family DNA binding protein